MISAQTAKRTLSLHQAQLFLARALWLILALASLALVLYGMVTNAVEWWHVDLNFCPPDEYYETCVVNNQAMLDMGITPQFYAVFFTLGLTFQNLTPFLVAALIFWRKFSNLYAIFFSLEIILLGSFHVDRIFQVYQNKYYPQFDLPVRVMAAIGVALMVLWYRFPDGRFVPRWMRLPGIAWYVGITTVTLFFPNSPLSTETWPPLVYALVGYTFILSVAAALVYRYLRVSGPTERQQIKWIVVFGAIYGVIHVTHDYILMYIQPGRLEVLRVLTILPLNYFVAGLFMWSIGAAILRHRLWDIDVIIRRTITYAMLTGALALLYYGSVIVLQAVITALTGQRQSDLVTVLSTLAIAAAFSPLRRQIKAGIDRAFFRRRYDAEGAIAEFSLAARSEVDLASLSERLVRQVENTIQPDRVSLWLRAPTREASAAPEPLPPVAVQSISGEKAD